MNMIKKMDMMKMNMMKKMNIVNMMNTIKKNNYIIIIALLIVMVLLALPGCDIIKEGITGERGKAEEDLVVEDEIPVVPAFPIIGKWFGVYGGSEYLEVVFTSDGKCELQPAVYPSDIFGPRYYGEYRWGGDSGEEIILDLYMGVSREVDSGNGVIWDEWSDGGLEEANTALNMTFRVYGGNMRSFALKAVTAGVDTQGYTVVRSDAFMVMVAEGDTTSFLYGSTPYDQNEGKNLNPSAPSLFGNGAERLYTTAELNVRCGPSTDFGSYGTVPLGTPVDRIAAAVNIDDWAFVLLANGGGWCNTDYLATNPPPPQGVDGGGDEAAVDDEAEADPE